VACDEIFHYVWDPIGINDSPAARSEYREYAAVTLRRLLAGATEQEIANYLDEVVTEYMGLGANTEKSRQIAERLATWHLFYFGGHEWAR